MPVSAYMALAFVFGFIPNKLMMMMMYLCLVYIIFQRLSSEDEGKEGRQKEMSCGKWTVLWLQSLNTVHALDF